MSSYGQFCPVAKAMEILDERWTLLVLRELLSGSTHFNELRRGVPKMSPALLSKRLRSLTRAGLVERSGQGQHVEYTLTASGQDLMGVVQAIGVWGLRWIPRLGDEDYDPHLLMWDLRRTVPTDRWPAGRTVVELQLSDVAPWQRSWWLVVTDGQADLCDADPGHEVTATILTDLRTLTRVWRGEQSWEGAQREGTLDLLAPSDVRRSLPVWLGRSQLAELAAITP